MKFTPENLLRIYMDGSFTDEAQVEFDRLMRQDPLFAEKVTQAVADRLGPVPESVLDGISGRLDGKVDGWWKGYKPSPVRRTLRLGAKGMGLMVLAAGLYLGFRHWAPLIHPVPAQGERNAVPDWKGKGAGGHRVDLTFSIQGRNVSQEAALHAEMERRVPVNLEAGDSRKKMEASRGGREANIHVATEFDRTAASPGERGEGGGPSAEASLGGPGGASSTFAPEGGGPGRLEPMMLQPSLPTSRASSARRVENRVEEGNSLRVAIDTQRIRKVGVVVLDPTGLLVRHLYNGVVPAGEHYVDWDGRDDAGNQVLPGDYTVVLDLGDRKMSGTLKVLSNP